MLIAAMSDSHNRHDSLIIPECDLLLHAGDATGMGYEHEIRKFAQWFNKQPAKHKIFVLGNHELMFEKKLPESKQWFYDECPNGIILINEEINIEGLSIWGSPWTPWFHNWAFNAVRGEEIRKHWDLIPNNIDVLITHGPAHGILDIVWDVSMSYPKERVGCFDLLDAIKRTKPVLHFCGHIHGSHGQHHEEGTSFYNVSICDELYAPTNPVTVVDYEKDQDPA